MDNDGNAGGVVGPMGPDWMTFPEPSTVAVTPYHPGLVPQRITRMFQVPVRSDWEKLGAGGIGVAETWLDSTLSPLAFTAVTTK